MADPAALSVAGIAIGQTAYTYAQFLPPLREVRKAGPGDNEMRGDVLLGQVTAGAVSMAVGVLLSYLTGSPTPAFAVLAIAIVIAIAYQYAMNGNRVMES
jgi:hypothetical protein